MKAGRRNVMVGMPILHKADKGLGCTVAVWHGCVTTEEMHEQLIRLARDPDFPPGPRHFVDGTTVETLTIPDPELVELLYEGTELLGGSVRLAVLLRPDFLAGATPEYPNAAGTMNQAIFTEFDAACAFLDVRPAAVATTIKSIRQLLPDPTF